MDLLTKEDRRAIDTNNTENLDPMAAQAANRSGEDDTKGPFSGFRQSGLGAGNGFLRAQDRPALPKPIRINLADDADGAIA